MALLLLAGTTVVWTARAQERQEKKPPTAGPMLVQGYIDLETPAFSVRLVRSSQTIAALKPKGAGNSTSRLAIYWWSDPKTVTTTSG